MTMEKEIKGTYGVGTPCTIFVYGRWYCIEGSKNINKTNEELNNGVDVEVLGDVDTLTSSEPIETLEELKKAVDE